MLRQISISFPDDLKLQFTPLKFYLSILLLTIKVATYVIREVVVKKCINHMHVCKMLESICTSTMGAYIYIYMLC